MHDKQGSMVIKTIKCDSVEETKFEIPDLDTIKGPDYNFQCVKCKKTDKKHEAFNLCKSCYEIARQNKERYANLWDKLLKDRANKKFFKKVKELEKLQKFPCLKCGKTPPEVKLYRRHLCHECH